MLIETLFSIPVHYFFILIYIPCSKKTEMVNPINCNFLHYRIWIITRIIHQSSNGAIIISSIDTIRKLYQEEHFSDEVSIKGTVMQILKSPYMFVFVKTQYPESFAILIPRILELFAREIFNTCCYFCMFVNIHFTYLTCVYLKN